MAFIKMNQDQYCHTTESVGTMHLFFFFECIYRWLLILKLPSGQQKKVGFPLPNWHYFSPILDFFLSVSLVDGGRLRTFWCDPMHTLRSSGYTLSGIYIDDLSWFLNLHHPAYKFMGFGRCAHPRKKKLF